MIKVKKKLVKFLKFRLIFWTPIPIQWYENMSGYSTEQHILISEKIYLFMGETPSSEQKIDRLKFLVLQGYQL